MQYRTWNYTQVKFTSVGTLIVMSIWFMTYHLCVLLYLNEWLQKQFFFKKQEATDSAIAREGSMLSNSYIVFNRLIFQFHYARTTLGFLLKLCKVLSVEYINLILSVCTYKSAAEKKKLYLKHNGCTELFLNNLASSQTVHLQYDFSCLSNTNRTRFRSKERNQFSSFWIVICISVT